ncbi:spore cortex biosynthesis protein YabQ [Gallintestinimicrobium propionicum]|uniref:spore cortex biosynthesis protein YabQ n=1 Tax=Gallintestinimicrobium propionicum TaxID=2981770 RepID=UPI0032BF3B5B
MSSEIAREGTFWLHSVLLGMAVTLVYDFLRIFRRVFPHGIFWISIEDLIYWCVVAGSFFSLLYLENNGTFRWFCVFGAAVGMLVVKSTASPFLVKAGARFGLWIKKVISYVARWLMRPVKYTFRIGKNGFSKIFRGARRSARILKKRLTSRLKLAKIALCKQNRKALRGRKNG